MTVPAAVLRIHWCGDPTDALATECIQQRSQGRPISARWAPLWECPISLTDFLLELGCIQDSPTCHFIFLSLLHEVRPALSDSFPCLLWLTPIFPLQPQPLPAPTNSLAFPILSWHLPLEGSKLHSNMERGDWKQVVRWTFETRLSHPWVKRISSWVAGGGHIVFDTRWWPSYQRFHCWWPGDASWWSWMPLQPRWFRILQAFRRYGEKAAYEGRRMLMKTDCF